ncbi:hypothetical protein [Streptomyces sp. NPDC056883]|uniref:hypothetical protein n=1 Tax=Streptomyces sp. NPDC056883 TaxID=3345959 RepID=UPI0036881815
MTGVLLAVLVSTGAEEAGCAPPAEGGAVNGDKGQACRYIMHFPYVERGKIVGQVDVTCYEAVLRQSLTVIVERKQADGWVEVDRDAFDKAPAKGVTKQSKLAVPCTPGAYRTRYHATVEALKEPDGMADKGGGYSPTAVISKEQCA